MREGVHKAKVSIKYYLVKPEEDMSTQEKIELEQYQIELQLIADKFSNRIQKILDKKDGKANTYEYLETGDS